MANKSYSDSTWDFIGVNTKESTHCFHAYPAMMIPQVAERLIAQHGQHAKLLFDPYCGTGTSLVEANRKNIHAIGTDLNPLARLIAQAKTTPLNLQVLDLYLKDFSDYLFSILFDIHKISVVTPNIKNIDYWFSPPVQTQLAVVNTFINGITDESIANFFKVAFSETVRESSWTRNGEFKLFRMTPQQMQRFNPDVFGLIQGKLARNKRGLKALLDMHCTATSRVCAFNTVEHIEQIENGSVDLIVTSPPYGDSRTTVAYGQFSRLANEWLGIDGAAHIDNQLMGGQIKRTAAGSLCELDEFNSAMEQIAAIDDKRANEVSAFYWEYQQSIENVAKTVKPGGHVCYVVGNRKVKGITLPTDEVTRCLFERQGFVHIETVIRNIPNKRMPSKNSPTNIVGRTDSTMNNEYIVVMKKCE
ncbi:DNA methyltransferase [Rhodoferax sp. 4810]|uniref:site-specific DNA-methyltransferase (cytosine-N(4)-specific) n=1 Tax=Thiospirillum jenense TaxID=1653858 RepID=A0A839H4E9_9GAMM|nr:DNA methyltransferase [Thiospirillum jenense]MBB1073067.1 DNA methyltransferase [Rhodoferax jenense]MBB1125015.1 DNA methyltransferase [Thiospirillum jenense]